MTQPTEQQIKYAQDTLEELSAKGRNFSERGYHSYAEQCWRIVEALRPFVPDIKSERRQS